MISTVYTIAFSDCATCSVYFCGQRFIAHWLTELLIFLNDITFGRSLYKNEGGISMWCMANRKHLVCNIICGGGIGRIALVVSLSCQKAACPSYVAMIWIMES